MQIEIYGTTTCSFCVKARQLCEVKKVKYSYVDVKSSPDVLRALERRIGVAVKTVPQIFIDGEHVAGGFTGLSTYLAMTALAAKF